MTYEYSEATKARIWEQMALGAERADAEEQAMTEKHSPLPFVLEVGEEFTGENWLVASLGGAEVDGRLVGVFITTDHVRVSQMDGDALSDGQFLVRAANSHAAMYEALKYCVADLEMLCPDTRGTPAAEDGRAALRLVDGPKVSGYPADLTSDEWAERSNNGP